VGDSVRISTPVVCRYYGGLDALGTHGHHFWIHDGRIGHGELRLTHGIPLADVASVGLSEREGGGSEVVNVRGLRGLPAERSEVFTDINVHTKDGHTGLWFVEGRDATWVSGKLTAALEAAGIPFADEESVPD
jgi:hypothetical protein